MHIKEDNGQDHYMHNLQKAQLSNQLAAEQGEELFELEMLKHYL